MAAHSQIVGIAVGVYLVTDGEGLTVLWPGQNPPDNGISPLLRGPKFTVQINLLGGERYFFNVREKGTTVRQREITTVYNGWSPTRTPKVMTSKCVCLCFSSFSVREIRVLKNVSAK